MIENLKHTKLADFITELDHSSITEERKENLQLIINTIKDKQAKKEAIHLNFVCTHNSRRSQLAQVWAQIMAGLFEQKVLCHSSGVEVTAFNHRAVKALQETGITIQVNENGNTNPIYTLIYSNQYQTIKAYSKLIQEVENQVSSFIAIMTCSHADQNCPFIPSAEKRIALRYDDPKEFDDTPEEHERYLKRSKQIATEMHYLFSSLKNA